MRLPRLALLSVAIWLCASLASLAADPAAKPAEPKFFDSDGVKIHYRVEGAGEPVLLIHGFTANINVQWVAPGIMPRLAEEFQVIALDNRGHGRSDKPHDPKLYGANMVEDAIRLLDHLGIKRAHVVGYSMGAFITNKLLSMHPERVITATLGGAGWYRDPTQRTKDMLELAESLEKGEGITPLIKRLKPEGAPDLTPEQLAGLNNMVLLINDAKALAAVVRGGVLMTVPEESILANKVPVLALIGEIDPLKDGVDQLLEVKMPKLEVVVIEGADHMTAFTDPLFVETLLRFLNEHRETPVAEPAAAAN